MTRTIATGLLLSLLTAGCAGQRGLFFDTTMQFGEGAAPTLDGHRGEGEWDDALRLPLSKGGDVWMKRSGDTLYLAVIMTNNHPVCLAMARGDAIEVGLAGALLGTARYAREDRTWRRTSSYRAVKIRGADSGEILEHLERAGWSAAPNGWYGEKFTELAVKLPPEGLKLALAVSMRASDRNAPHWPPGLNGGLLEPELLQGKAPDALKFDTDKWPLFVPTAPTEG